MNITWSTDLVDLNPEEIDINFYYFDLQNNPDPIIWLATVSWRPRVNYPLVMLHRLLLGSMEQERNIISEVSIILSWKIGRMKSMRSKCNSCIWLGDDRPKIRSIKSCRSCLKRIDYLQEAKTSQCTQVLNALANCCWLLNNCSTFHGAVGLSETGSQWNPWLPVARKRSNDVGSTANRQIYCEKDFPRFPNLSAF